jgi:hypothetical protein
MRRITLALAFLAASGPLQAADDWITPGTETFKLNLGGIINRNNTTLRVDGPNTSGTEFDLEDVAGLEREASSLYAAATWRFAPNHRVGFQYYEARRTASKTIDRTLVIEDQVIPINTKLSTEHDSAFLILNYQYSFVRNEKLEFAGLLGLYGARNNYRFSATLPVVDVSASTTVPLPVIGASLDYFVNPRWTVSLYAEGLSVSMGQVEGRMYFAGISTDYMLTRNFGLGVGYNATSMTVQAGEDEFSGKLGWRQGSFFGYAQLRY